MNIAQTLTRLLPAVSALALTAGIQGCSIITPFTKQEIATLQTPKPIIGRNPLMEELYANMGYYQRISNDVPLVLYAHKARDLVTECGSLFSREKTDLLRLAGLRLKREADTRNGEKVIVLYTQDDYTRYVALNSPMSTAQKMQLFATESVIYRCKPSYYQTKGVDGSLPVGSDSEASGPYAEGTGRIGKNVDKIMICIASSRFDPEADYYSLHQGTDICAEVASKINSGYGISFFVKDVTAGINNTEVYYYDVDAALATIVELNLLMHIAESSGFPLELMSRKLPLLGRYPSSYRGRMLENFSMRDRGQKYLLIQHLLRRVFGFESLIPDGFKGTETLTAMRHAARIFAMPDSNDDWAEYDETLTHKLYEKLLNVFLDDLATPSKKASILAKR